MKDKEKQIELINDIIFNAIQHGSDGGGSYDQNYEGLTNSLIAWLDYNQVIGYEIGETERKDNWGYDWLVVQIIKGE